MRANWPASLRLMELRQGPEDERDDEVNGDPTSHLGEETEEGFEEMSDYPDESGLDDSFDDDLGADDEEDEDSEDAEDDGDEA